MKHVALRLFSAFALITALLAAAPPFAAQAAARVQPAASTIPADLYQAFLQASANALEPQNYAGILQAGGLSFHLDGAGLQATNPGLSWNIAFSSFGRGQSLPALSASKVVQSGNRLQYLRGALTEWYSPTVLGLEQGFTIQSAPAGTGMLTLQLNVQTGLQGKALGDASGLIFSGVADQILHYDNLRAFDTKGKVLPASLNYSNGQATIQVNDLGATYPIVIDPLIYLQNKAISSDGAANDHFGLSVALSGDTALVGAYLAAVSGNASQGAAYVFTRSGTAWIFQQKLTAADGAPYDEFGSAVALSGETALVGAPYATVGSNSEQGAAYVFSRSGSNWSLQQKLTATGGEASNRFGASLALSGDTALVGAYLATINGNTGQGAAYVFTLSGGTWTFQQTLSATDGLAGDEFGSSVALSGYTALVGANHARIGNNAGQGAAYVFARSDGAWILQQKLIATGGAFGDAFGSSVASSGDTALVGAPYAKVGSNANQGAAYFFTGAGSSWTQQKLIASDGSADDRFGYAVALSDNSALVGAYAAKIGSNNSQGAAYLFNRTGNSWSLQQKLSSSDGAAGDEFGYSVAMAGDTGLVGANAADVSDHTKQGAVYTFAAYRSNVDLATAASSNATQASPGDTVSLTASVTNLSSVNADNIIDQVSLPSGLNYVSNAPSQGSYDPSSGSWSVGTISPNITANLIIQATVDLIPPQTLNFSNTILNLDANDANNSALASLVVLSPVFLAKPPAWDFGLVNTSQVYPAKAFSISNSGQTNLVLGELTLSGANASAFKLSSDACSNQTLAPTATCTIKVTFTPTFTGPQSASINIPDNSQSIPHQIALNAGTSELTSNGGFNTYPNSSSMIPTIWSAVNFSSTDGKDATNLQEGAASVKITGNSGAAKTLSQIIPINSKWATFQFSLWAKASAIPVSSGVTQAQVLFYNGAKLVQTSTISLPAGTYDFTQQTLSITPPVTSYNNVQVVLTYSKASGTVWFDNISLRALRSKVVFLNMNNLAEWV